MDLTTFLAQLWGPVILAVGLGALYSERHYERVYREFEKEPFAMLVFGMFAIVLGTVHIMAHNVWDSFLAGFVSFLGFGLLIKGAMFTIFPGTTRRWSEVAIKSRFASVSTVLMLAGGLYLSYIAYFA